MKKKFTEAQTFFALRQAESGTPVPEIIRKMEISEVTFYRWKKKYAGRVVSIPRALSGGRKLRDPGWAANPVAESLTEKVNQDGKE